MHEKVLAQSYLLWILNLPLFPPLEVNMYVTSYVEMKLETPESQSMHLFNE